MRNLTREFFQKTIELKKIKRQGWLDHEIQFNRIESVADHVFGVALLCYCMTDSREETQEKAIAGALVHDIAESIIGDISPKSGVSQALKFEKEKNAMIQLNELIKADVLAEWLTLEEKSSTWARLVKQLDKIEMLIQALIHETKNMPAKLDDFWNVEFKDEIFKKMKNELVKLRGTRSFSLE
ncbi:MAG: HD domain-containing protein [Candidatus Helarchaeota archaeon]